MKKNKELTINQILKRRKTVVRASDLYTIVVMYIGIFFIFTLLFAFGISNLITNGFTFKSVTGNIGILFFFIVSITYATTTSIRIKRYRDYFEKELSKYNLEENKYCFIIVDHDFDYIIIDNIKRSLKQDFPPEVNIEILPSLWFNYNYALYRIDSVVSIIEIDTSRNPNLSE
jgi:hypothetical protein